MGELDMLKRELQEVNNEIIKLGVRVETAKQTCADILARNNVNSVDELKAKLNEMEKQYLDGISQATLYLADTKQKLAPYEDSI